jgi:hypothetical protein
VKPDPYIRVYYRVIDDPRFVGIYADNDHLATWLRLLLVADAVWPASVPVPRSARKASLTALVQAGLVEYVGNDHYRIHGLDAERNMRADSGRNAAAVRWQSARIPSPNADPMPSRAKPSKAEQAQTRARTRDDAKPVPVEDEDGYDRVVAWMASIGAWVDSPKLQTDLARLVDRDGPGMVLEAMADLKASGNTEAAQLIYGARNVIHPLPKSKPRDIERENEAENDRKHHEAELARTRRLIEDHERRARQQ